jgi:hypothetical protein
VKVLLLGSSYSYYQSFPLRILYGGVLLKSNLRTYDVGSELIGTARFLLPHPDATDFGVVVIVTLIALITIAAIRSLSLMGKFTKLIAITNDAEANRIVWFADYIRENQPKKLDPALRDSPAQPSPLQTAPSAPKP